MPRDILPEADFQTLGLEPGCSQAEIKQAYRKLAKKWHPDRFHSQSYEMRALAEEKFREINEAYKRISLDGKDRPGPQTKPTPSDRSAREPRKEKAEENGRATPPRRFHPARFAAAVFFVLIAAAAATQLPSFLPLFTTVERESGDEPARAPAVPESVEPSSPESGDTLLSKAPPLPSPNLLAPEDPSEARDTFFTIGSTVSDVLLAQGAPARVQGQTWIYGLSEIQFKNGQVWRFNNFDGALRVRMMPSRADGAQAPQAIALGSTENDVLLVHGTPTRVETDKWFYGFAEIRFKDGRVREYDNYFGNLKIRLLPSMSHGSRPPKKFFTIGSSPDDVLEVQGTPTGIRGNSWTYNFSSVFFRDGKVQHVSNSDGTLRFVPPPEHGEKSG